MLDINSLCTDYDLAAIRRRLDRNAFKFGPDKCWVWVGLAVNDDGYGRFGIQPPEGPQVKFGAHRVAWVVNKGPIPEGLHVLHHCDNRACINPDHMFLGTHQDNMDDKTRKGRHPLKRQALTAKTAAAIRSDPRPHLQIAKSFRVSRTTVILVKQGKTW